ncbi:MAG: hypothetical protein R3B97_01570 [Dehalococcoidia bacterium]|nr:hypothetical protein [Dehalococcoidia bacterium]MCB9486259.1 hypothetical protein [Thermoflexaceae bacterium]
MNVEFTDDELVEALTVIINRIADEAGLSDRDRAMLKRWRSGKMKLGSDDMDDFVRKANEDLARSFATRAKSQIRRPDWV